MAIIACRECAAEVSEYASKCPKCGIWQPNKQRWIMMIAIGYAIPIGLGLYWWLT
jgi:hypothetical protein